jgi:plastocyanin domain-containing protein
MTADRIAVIALGIGLLGFLYVFFFGKRRPTVAQPLSSGEQEVTIVVEGGYDPDVVVAKQGVPLWLVFDRRESSPCSDEVVLPEFEIRRSLPAFEKTTVQVLPRRIGEFPFSCGMNMLHGTIKVVE